MSLYTFGVTDNLPVIKTLKGLQIKECTNLELLSWMGCTSVSDVSGRLASDHVAFVAYLANLPAAFGWMARTNAKIGELNHELRLPPGNRYLWNFRTMEAFRGLGIYPAMLQHIIQFEKSAANRFWIIHAPENKASMKGIKKAGFRYVGSLYNKDENTFIEATIMAIKQKELLREMNIVISNNNPPSCWNCSNPYLKRRVTECCCASSSMQCISN